MKIALVTTTIRVPHVLRLYRRCDPDVKFFIAGDLKSPEADIGRLCDQIDPASPLTVVDQKSLLWKCSELIGWNTIQRRNIATLEALKWGADIICFVDDDNIPIGTDYFESYQAAFYQAGHNGLLASPEVPWFDIGQFLDPKTPHRGYPRDLIGRQPRLSHVVDAKIGACAGIVLGDPDTTAEWRQVHAPHVLHASPLLNLGIAVNPRHTCTVFNTQNSAVLREFAPAMLLCPQFCRYDDIVASLVCQRVMCETNHHVLFGPPFVYQERNVHDIWRDVDDEQWGQANIHAVQQALWNIKLERDFSIIESVKVLYAALDVRMPGVKSLADAWVDDCVRAMS